MQSKTFVATFFINNEVMATKVFQATDGSDATLKIQAMLTLSNINYTMMVDKERGGYVIVIMDDNLNKIGIIQITISYICEEFMNEVKFYIDCSNAERETKDVI